MLQKKEVVMTPKLPNTIMALAILGGALVAATPALTQARWGHADQPMPKSYSDRGWSSGAYAAAPMYADPSYGYQSYAYQPNYGYPRYGVQIVPRLVSPYESYGWAQDYGGRTFDRFDAPNAFGHN
jgi:hypothetical protein